MHHTGSRLYFLCDRRRTWGSSLLRKKLPTSVQGEPVTTDQVSTQAGDTSDQSPGSRCQQGGGGGGGLTLLSRWVRDRVFCQCPEIPCAGLLWTEKPQKLTTAPLRAAHISKNGGHHATKLANECVIEGSILTVVGGSLREPDRNSCVPFIGWGIKAIDSF